MRALTGIDRLLVLSRVRCGHSVFWPFWGGLIRQITDTDRFSTYLPCIVLAVEPDVTPNFCVDMLFKETFLTISFHWQYSRCVLSISSVCPDRGPEVGDSGSWDL
jgi:hypothetical protein